MKMKTRTRVANPSEDHDFCPGSFGRSFLLLPTLFRLRFRFDYFLIMAASDGAVCAVAYGLSRMPDTAGTSSETGQLSAAKKCGVTKLITTLLLAPVGVCTVHLIVSRHKAP